MLAGGKKEVVVEVEVKVVAMNKEEGRTYRFVTLCVSAFRAEVPSLLTSAMEGASGAEFCESSVEKSIFGNEVLAIAGLSELRMRVAGCGQRT